MPASGPGAADLWRLLTAHASIDDRLDARFRFDPAAAFPDEPGGLQWAELAILAGDREKFAYFARDPDYTVSPMLRRADGRMCSASSVLWARIESGAQVKALQAFRAGPTMVVREGDTLRRVALWALTAPLSLNWLERAGRRIAYRLGAAQKWAVPEEALRIPVPGTTLRFGRESRPLGVGVEFFAPERVWTARQIVGSLKDPPERNTDWKKAAA